MNPPNQYNQILIQFSTHMQEHLISPEVELEELTQIYVNRGLTYYLAKQVLTTYIL